MARMCAFCTARPASREPLLPAWLARVLDGSDPWTAGDGAAAEGAAIDLGDRAPKVICQACHDHFAATLEEPAADLLRPAMLDATPLALAVDEQRLVALWTVATTARLVAARRSLPGMPVGQRLQVRAGELPPDCVVALGRAAAPHAALEVGRLRPPGMRATTSDGDALPWYLALTAGHLIVVAWGAGALPAGTQLAPPPALQFSRLTPPSGEAAWPPMWPLEAHDLQPLPPVRLRPAEAAPA